MDLQQIGASHPRIKQVIDLQKNTKPNPQKLFVAEGLWAHNALLEADTEIATFLWCPEAAYSDEATKRSEQVAARAGQSFRVSEKTLARVSEISLEEWPTATVGERVADVVPRAARTGHDAVVVLDDRRRPQGWPWLRQLRGGDVALLPGQTDIATTLTQAFILAVM